MVARVEPGAETARVVQATRLLQSDVRPLPGCCGHHSLAHDAFGCLITGCPCRRLEENVGAAGLSAQTGR